VYMNQPMEPGQPSVASSEAKIEVNPLQK
jgi:hypothetical protein